MLRKSLILLLILLTGITMTVFAGGDKEAEIAEDELYVIKMLHNEYQGMGSDTPVGKIIKEKFNIDFEFERFTGDWQEKASLWLAAGDYPEIVYVQQNHDLLKKYINAGVLVELDSLAAEYGPDYLEFYKDINPYVRSDAEDGKLYYWPTGSPEGQEMYRLPFEMIVRMDLFKKLGYPEIPKTEKEWLDFFIKAKKVAPEVDGKETVGLTMPMAEPWATGLLPAMGVRSGLYQFLEVSKIVVNCEDNTTEYILNNENAKDAMRFFNKLYREGLFDKESFTSKQDQTKEKYNSALPLGGIFTRWLSSGANPTLVANGKADMQYVVLPFRLESNLENNDTLYRRVKTVRPFDNYAITDKARYPERIMELINWICTPEGQNLIGWGIEGVHYTVEDGKKVPTDEFYDGYKNTPDYLTNEGIDRTFHFLTLGNTFDENGQSTLISSDPIVGFEAYTDEMKEFYAHYGWDSYLGPWEDIDVKGFPISDWQFSESLDPTLREAKIQVKVKELHDDATVKLIMAKDDTEFEKIWQESVAELDEIGGDQALELVRKQYEELSAKLDMYR